jgi:hypothetical protein
MKYSNFDRWLTTQKPSGVLHMDAEVLQEAWDDFYANRPKVETVRQCLGEWLDMNIDNLSCTICTKSVGVLIDDMDDVARLHFSGFHQLDEDGEVLHCENCYKEEEM